LTALLFLSFQWQNARLWVKASAFRSDAAAAGGPAARVSRAVPASDGWCLIRGDDTTASFQCFNLAPKIDVLMECKSARKPHAWPREMDTPSAKNLRVGDRVDVKCGKPKHQEWKEAIIEKTPSKGSGSFDVRFIDTEKKVNHKMLTLVLKFTECAILLTLACANLLQSQCNQERLELHRTHTDMLRAHRIAGKPPAPGIVGLQNVGNSWYVTHQKGACCTDAQADMPRFLL
jgi:hypothetical protein